MTKASMENSTPRICLYGADRAESTHRARANLNRALEALGLGWLTVEFIDVLSDPQKTFEDGVLVTPTLIVHADDARHVLVGTIDDDSPLRQVLIGHGANA